MHRVINYYHKHFHFIVSALPSNYERLTLIRQKMSQLTAVDLLSVLSGSWNYRSHVSVVTVSQLTHSTQRCFDEVKHVLGSGLQNQGGGTISNLVSCFTVTHRRAETSADLLQRDGKPRAKLKSKDSRCDRQH